MAYFIDQDEEDEKKISDAEGGFTTAAGVGPDTPGEIAGPTGATPSTARPKGSGFVNLQEYLRANVGEGQRMADIVSGDLRTEAEEAKRGITERVSADIGSFEEKAQVQDPGASYQLGKDMGQSEFDKYYYQDVKPADYYTSDFADLGTEYGQITEAAGSQSGRTALLGESRFAEPGRYSSGQQGFDAFLIGAGDVANGGTTGTTFESDVKGLDLAGGLKEHKEAEIGRFGEAVSERDTDIQAAQDKFRGEHAARLQEATDRVNEIYTAVPAILPRNASPEEVIASEPNWDAMREAQDKAIRLANLSGESYNRIDINKLESEWKPKFEEMDSFHRQHKPIVTDKDDPDYFDYSGTY